MDGGEALVGVSEGRFMGLDLVEPLYLGGVPDFQNVHRQTGMTSGFKGCISRLVTGNILNTGFVMNAVKKVSVALYYLFNQFYTTIIVITVMMIYNEWPTADC